MLWLMILLAQAIPAAPTNVKVSQIELACNTQLLDVTVTPYVSGPLVTLHMFDPATGAQLWRDMKDRELSQILMAREKKCFCTAAK